MSCSLTERATEISDALQRSADLPTHSTQLQRDTPTALTLESRARYGQGDQNASYCCSGQREVPMQPLLLTTRIYGVSS